MKPLLAKQCHASGRSEKGVALLIAIFALMLISAVAVSLVLMSGTGSSIDANYRNSTNAFYSAQAGLEEVRGRLSPNDANTIINLLPNPPNETLSVTPQVAVQYIVNPAPNENANNILALYPDRELQNEWGPAAAFNVLPNILSDSNVLGLNGPMYKWVRITGLTEAAMNTDVDGDNNLDPISPIYYANGNEYVNNPLNAGIGGSQVYRITALAALPDGSRRLLQYDVTMNSTNLSLPSPLTLPGQNVTFKGANSNQWFANGQDGSGNGNNSSWAPVPGCNPNPTTSLPSVGVTDPPGNNANVNAVKSGIPRPTHYTGAGLPTPSVADVTLNTNLQTPASLDQLVQNISQSADAVINPPSGTPATPANLPSSMSASNPQVVVVNGDFSMSGNFTGYGLLVVTGNFAYSGTTGWDGLILVVGEGTTSFLGNGGGNAGFNGGIFVATTKDAAGNELPALGNVNFDINGGGGNGVYYDSCWITNAQNSFKKFNVLSFREILNF